MEILEKSHDRACAQGAQDWRAARDHTLWDSAIFPRDLAVECVLHYWRDGFTIPLPSCGIVNLVSRTEVFAKLHRAAATA